MRGVIQTYRKMIEEVINAEKKHHDEDAEKADDFTADFIYETVS